MCTQQFTCSANKDGAAAWWWAHFLTAIKTHWLHLDAWYWIDCIPNILLVTCNQYIEFSMIINSLYNLYWLISWVWNDIPPSVTCDTGCMRRVPDQWGYDAISAPTIVVRYTEFAVDRHISFENDVQKPSNDFSPQWPQNPWYMKYLKMEWGPFWHQLPWNLRWPPDNRYIILGGLYTSCWASKILALYIIGPAESQVSWIITQLGFKGQMDVQYKWSVAVGWIYRNCY